ISLIISLINFVLTTMILKNNVPLIYKGERVYLQCKITGGGGTKWTYEWRPTRLNEPETSNEYIIIHSANETHSGGYSCRGTNGSDSTAWSDVVVLTVFSNKVVVTRRPNWPQMFSGETITLTCEVQGGETTEWTYEWRRAGSFIYMTREKKLTFNVSESNSGDYRCLCLLKDDGFSLTEWSEPISVTDSTELPVGGNVMLTCSLNASSSSFSWKYFWYRGEKSSDMKMYYKHTLINVLNVLCCVLVAVLTIDPNWLTFYDGERVTFTCDMNEGNNTDWEYEIRRNGEQFIQSYPHKSYTLQPIQTDQSGEYQCCGVRKSSSDTKCSGTVSLTVTGDSSSHVLLIVGLISGVLLIILLLSLWRYRRSNGESLFFSHWIGSLLHQKYFIK
uniref:Ig-like domain-containing protein n=1 Tax=Poecilia reticulata TaxID=8081 RepID=A0A3P9N0P6_POERE